MASNHFDRKYKYTPSRFMLPTSRYDKKRADHAVNFISQLCHTKGEWEGKPFKLLPWQETIVRDVFGVIKPNGKRQFNHCFVEVCKKSGKSELAAAIALLLLCADGENSAEIYGVANDRNQAGIVFDVACRMVRMNPTLSEFCKIIDHTKRIIFKPTNSFYAALSSAVATKFGLNTHGCIFDELLGQPNRKLHDTMTQGAGAARRQPLSFVITTAGNDRTSVCYEEHCRALDILEGRKTDPTFYPVVFYAKDDDDWTSEETWRRVNPSYGKIVEEEFYHNFCQTAKQDVSLEMHFRQYFLCQWVYSAKRWLPMDKYDLGATPIDMDYLAGRECYGGLDLASSDDIAAFVLVFPPDEADGKYHILPFFWIPENNMIRRVRRDKVLYQKWHQEGFLNATDGNIIHYDFIEQKILELSQIYQIKEVMYDQWGAVQMSQNLKRHDFEMVEFIQGFKSFTEPSKELFRLVLDERFIHGGNPVLRWCFENVYVETDAAANIKPSKKKSLEKIDGAVAAIMALSGATRSFVKTKSVYSEEGRGLLIWGGED